MTGVGRPGSAPLEPGSQFGDYEILDLLGMGGMGSVYRAREKTLERVVALKTLAPDLSEQPGFVERFLKEARAVARLNHPNIVQIFAFGSVEGVYYLAMELLDGHSLGFYLKSHGPWREKDAVTICRQACQALAVAHTEGIVHRDIKPENLILTTTGQVKVVDLGIAKRVGEDQSITQTGSAIGTPDYMSPEQIRGRRDIDGRSDIYSLGATLYHLVTGRTPFRGESGPHVMSMHLMNELPDPRTYAPMLSEGICAVLRKMMAKEREERYVDISALDLDLSQLQLGRMPRPAEPSATLISSQYSAPARASAPQAGELAPAFAAEVLERLEQGLAAEIGPMAKVLVRRAARKAPNLESLCEELASQVAPGSAQDRFRQRFRGLTTGSTSLGAAPASGAVPAATPGASGTAGDATEEGWSGSGSGRAIALGEGDLLRVETELAHHIGPLARVLVRRAATRASSLAELVATLESNVADPAARLAFRRAALQVD